MQGPAKIILTLTAEVDKNGRVCVDWSAEAEVPKGVTPPRIDQYLAHEIMECAEHCMNLKGSLNWQVQPVQLPAGDGPDQLP